MVGSNNFEDRTLFIERCRDTLKDDRGLIVPLDDDNDRIRRLLELVGSGRRIDIDSELTSLVNQVWVS